VGYVLVLAARGCDYGAVANALRTCSTASPDRLAEGSCILLATPMRAICV